jgi:hypothetical protein
LAVERAFVLFLLLRALADDFFFFEALESEDLAGVDVFDSRANAPLTAKQIASTVMRAGLMILISL